MFSFLYVSTSMCLTFWYHSASYSMFATMIFGNDCRRRFQSSSAAIQKDVLPPVDEKVSQFHKELRETCLDVMSRYSFGNMSNNYHR